MKGVIIPIQLITAQMLIPTMDSIQKKYDLIIDRVVKCIKYTLFYDRLITLAIQILEQLTGFVNWHLTRRGIVS